MSGQENLDQAPQASTWSSDLDEHRFKIYELYIRKDLPLKKVMQILRDENGCIARYATNLARIERG